MRTPDCKKMGAGYSCKSTSSDVHTLPPDNCQTPQKDMRAASVIFVGESVCPYKYNPVDDD